MLKFQAWSTVQTDVEGTSQYCKSAMTVSIYFCSLSWHHMPVCIHFGAARRVPEQYSAAHVGLLRATCSACALPHAEPYAERESHSTAGRRIYLPFDAKTLNQNPLSCICATATYCRIRLQGTTGTYIACWSA